jgi:hypothetical protein
VSLGMNYSFILKELLIFGLGKIKQKPRKVFLERSSISIIYLLRVNIMEGLIRFIGLN